MPAQLLHEPVAKDGFMRGVVEDVKPNETGCEVLVYYNVSPYLKRPSSTAGPD